jgi:hypothetical protein
VNKLVTNAYSRFIVFYLCDNDFANQLERAVRIVWESAEAAASCGHPWSEDRFHDSVCRLMAELDSIRDTLPARPEEAIALKAYFHQNLRVEFALHAPTIDHDQGSCAISTSNSYIWRF